MPRYLKYENDISVYLKMWEHRISNTAGESIAVIFCDKTDNLKYAAYRSRISSLKRKGWLAGLGMRVFDLIHEPTDADRKAAEVSWADSLGLVSLVSSHDSSEQAKPVKVEYDRESEQREKRPAVIARADHVYRLMWQDSYTASDGAVFWVRKNRTTLETNYSLYRRALLMLEKRGWLSKTAVNVYQLHHIADLSNSDNNSAMLSSTRQAVKSEASADRLYHHMWNNRFITAEGQNLGLRPKPDEVDMTRMCCIEANLILVNRGWVKRLTNNVYELLHTPGDTSSALMSQPSKFEPPTDNSPDSLYLRMWRYRATDQHGQHIWIKQDRDTLGLGAMPWHMAIAVLKDRSWVAILKPGVYQLLYIPPQETV